MHSGEPSEYLEDENKSRGVTPSLLHLALADFKTRGINGLEIYNLLVDLTKSYEYYSAMHTPVEDWDEYDHMMYPIWIRLDTILQRR